MARPFVGTDICCVFVIGIYHLLILVQKHCGSMYTNELIRWIAAVFPCLMNLLTKALYFRFSLIYTRRLSSFYELSLNCRCVLKALFAGWQS